LIPDRIISDDERRYVATEKISEEKVLQVLFREN
jgi:hypothetical protein